MNGDKNKLRRMGQMNKKINGVKILEILSKIKWEGKVNIKEKLVGVEVEVERKEKEIRR